MYEQVRSAIVAGLIDKYDNDAIKDIIGVIDHIMVDYEVVSKPKSIIPYQTGLPEIAKYFLASRGVEGLAKSSLRTYKLILTLFFKSVNKPVEAITANDVRVWLYQYQSSRNVSLRSMSTYRFILSSFFKWAASEEYIAVNPLHRVKPIKYTVKPRTAMTQLELEYVRNACKSSKEKAIVEMLYSTGCRIAELANMKKSDVDWQSGTVSILGKGSKYRTGYINARATVALQEYLASRHDDDDALIVRDRAPYTAMTIEGYEYIIRRLMKRVKNDVGKNVTPHIFRHTTATIALQNGMPVQDIQRMLGHSNIATTMVYAETNLNEVESEHRKRVI